MAIVVANGDPADGSLYTNGHRDENGQVNSNLNFQADARAGTGATLIDDPMGAQVLTIGGGMWNNSATVDRKESFIAFRPAGGLMVPVGIGEVELVNAAVRHGRNGPNTHSGAPYTDDSIRWFIRDWTTVTTSEWMDLNGLQGGTIPEFETKNWIQDGTDDLYEVSGRRMYSDALTKLAAKGSLCYVLTMTSATTDYPAAGSRDQGFTAYLPSANNISKPTYCRPTAILKFVRRHALNHVLGASIQLVDGTAVFLRYDDTNEKISLYHQKISQTTPTLIADLKLKTPYHDWSGGVTNYYGIEPGNQTFGITRDKFNNIYVAGSRGNEQTDEYNNQFYNIQCFKYTGNGTAHSWLEINQGASGYETVGDAKDDHRGQPNNFAPVWLPSSDGGTDGMLATMHSRRDGQWARFQMGLQTEYAGWLQGKTATIMHGRCWTSDGAATSVWWRPWNAAATGLDAFADGNTVRFASFSPAEAAKPDERSTAGWVTVPSNQQPPRMTFPATSLSANSPHDPDAKVRAVWLGDQSPYWGIARHGHILLLSKGTDTIYKQIDLSASGITGFPSRADLQKSAAWDVIWVNNQDRIAIYYRDSNNVRKIRRVFWDYVTNTLSASEDFTPTALGNSGNDIIAIRLPRQQTDVRCMLLDVAMQDGGGAPAGLITIRDTSMDVPPSAPTIQPIDQFNAGGTKAIQWVFNDNNAGDSATYQDVEVRNLATGVTAHFVNHVTAVLVDSNAKTYRYTIGASVLTNDTQYQIRIRTYDSVDAVGDWSPWTNFATTATGGLVKITEPATDLEPLNKSSVLIKWTYSNSNPAITQSGYRLRVYDDVAGTLFYDSNVVTSVATERLVTGLESDVVYRVEMTIIDSNAQSSGAGTRLVMPDYNNPSVPHIVVNPQGGCIQVRVTNPPPTGENPVTLENQIARKQSGEDDSHYVVIGTCPPNGVFTDWTVASGVEYTYRARGSS